MLEVECRLQVGGPYTAAAEVELVSHVLQKDSHVRPPFCFVCDARRIVQLAVEITSINLLSAGSRATVVDSQLLRRAPEKPRYAPTAHTNLCLVRDKDWYVKFKASNEFSQARISFTTCPCTSVSRKSRP